MKKLRSFDLSFFRFKHIRIDKALTSRFNQYSLAVYLYYEYERWTLSTVFRF